MNLLVADTADIPVIRRIAAETWPAAYGAILGTAQIDYMLALMYSSAALARQFNQGHRFFLLQDCGEPAGFAGFEHRYEPGAAKLHKLYVLPGCQGKGAGAMLLDAVKTEAIRAGQQTLILNVNRFNPAVHFYRKHNFRKIREEDIDIGSGYLMNDFVMECRLQKECGVRASGC